MTPDATPPHRQRATSGPLAKSGKDAANEVCWPNRGRERSERLPIRHMSERGRRMTPASGPLGLEALL